MVFVSHPYPYFINSLNFTKNKTNLSFEHINYTQHINLYKKKKKMEHHRVFILHNNQSKVFGKKKTLKLLLITTKKKGEQKKMHIFSKHNHRPSSMVSNAGRHDGRPDTSPPPPSATLCLSGSSATFFASEGIKQKSMSTGKILLPM